MDIYSEIAALRERISNLERIEQPAKSGGLPVYPSLTAGSVLFAGTGGVVAQDNSNLYWDDTNNCLGIGTNSPASSTLITMDGLLRVRQAGSTRYRSDYYVTGGTVTINAFDDTGSVYIPFQTTALSQTMNNSTALTNTTTALNLVHLTSGTAANGLGYDIHTWSDTTTTNRLLATIRSQWVNATDASRASRLRFFVYDAASARQALTLESSGSAALVGFYGATAVAQAAAITAPTGGTTIDTQARTAISSIITALKNIGITA